MQIGTAFDIHRFSNQVPSENGASQKNSLRLGLVEFSDFPQLEADSDGDVVAHAIADALLLATGLPDLGGTIGIGNPKWSQASGQRILEHVNDLVRKNGYKIESISAQILAKQPKLLPYLARMSQNLSHLLQCQVNVAATTTDGTISELGDGQAVGCIATALVMQTC